MSLKFAGTRWMPVSELGLVQLYLSAQALEKASASFSMESLCADPIKVYDFGNGRFTISPPEDMSRAFLAWQAGMSAVPVVYDPEDYLGYDGMQPLFLDEILWGEKLGLHSIADLKDRIMSDEDFRRRVILRCERGNDLFMETNPADLPAYAALRPDLHLYGISDDLKTLYFEDENEVETALPVPENL